MKPLNLLTVMMLACAAASGQNRTEDFEITLPAQKISNSLYSNIKYIDSRYDTTHMGIVQLGAFNKKARVVPKTHFGLQLSNVMNSLTDATAAQNELLFQLRQFSFAEVTGAMSEKGYCYLRADLYSNTNGRYQKINSIDTVILIKAMDVTRALFRNGSRTITDFIAGSLQRPAVDGMSYSYDDLVNMDNIEKQKIKLYTAESYADGLYLTHKSFMEQTPDKPATVEIKDGKLASVKTIDENGKQVKVRSNDVYAVAHQGLLFISTDYGYYPLEKRDNDFYFTGKAKVTANPGDVIAASFFFGIIGGLIASDASATFEMKIDHLNGGFMRIREVK